MRYAALQVPQEIPCNCLESICRWVIRGWYWPVKRVHRHIGGQLPCEVIVEHGSLPERGAKNYRGAGTLWLEWDKEGAMQIFFIVRGGDFFTVLARLHVLMNFISCY